VTDWEKLLTEATALVQERCASVGADAERARILGRGASGDETLLADKEAERLIIESLGSARDLRIVSEEAGEVGPKASRYVAVVDPLDGSSNFSRAIPFYCSSICIIDGSRLREARWALVRNLVNGDVYYAEKMAGAFRNGKRMYPSQVGELAAAVAAVDLSRAEAKAIKGLEPLLSKLRRVVHLGANALEICMVADGAIDCFVDARSQMRITDIAGAYLIAREAGAPVTTERGEEIDPPLDLGGRLRAVASGNRKLHEGLLKELAGLRGRRL